MKDVRRLRQGDRRSRVEPAFERLPVGVRPAHQETGERELAEGAGGAHRVEISGPVEVGENRSSPRVRHESAPLLSGVFEREEERLGDRPPCRVEGGEHVDVSLRSALRRPVGWERSRLVELGRDQVDDLVERRGDRHFVGGDGSVAGVCRLEQTRITDDLVRRRR